MYEFIWCVIDDWKRNPMLRFIIYWIGIPLILLASLHECHAQSAPSFRFNDALYKVIETKAVRQGFPANDNRIIQTATAIGQRAAATAASEGALATAGRALLWAPVAGRAALALGGQIALSTAIQWALDSSGNIISSYSNGTGSAGSSLNQGGAYYSSSISGHTCFSGTPQAQTQACIPALSSYETAKLTAQGYSSVSVSSVSCALLSGRTDYMSCSISISYISANKTYTSKDGPLSISISYQASGSPISCPSGMAADGACTSAASGKTTFTTTWAAADGISDAAKTDPVSPALVAADLDYWWRQAAGQLGYTGLPYTYADPVTSSDAVAVQQSSPAKWPTIGDLLSPVNKGAVTGSVATVPIPGNTDQTGPLPTTGPISSGAGDPVNLGTDPAIPAPTLETTPTMKAILDPLFSFFPTLKAYQVPSHASSCPVYSFNFPLWNQELRMDKHCTLIENNRQIIASAMVLGWTLLSLVIIVSS